MRNSNEETGGRNLAGFLCVNTNLNNKISKDFVLLGTSTGSTVINIDLDAYSLIQVIIIPNGNIYNEMVLSINTQRLKGTDYNNFGVSRIWYRTVDQTVYAYIGFSNTGALSLEWCQLITPDDHLDFCDNSTIIVYGI